MATGSASAGHTGDGEQAGEQASRQNPQRQKLTTDNNESRALPPPELEPLHGLPPQPRPSQPRARQHGRSPSAGPLGTDGTSHTSLKLESKSL